MSRTITALFDSRADADAGAERLRQAGVDASGIAVHDQATYKATSDHATHKDQGFWGSIKSAFVTREDRQAYEEGMRRGGFLLTADIPDDRTPAAVKALEEANSINLDERSRQWRSTGWDDGTRTVGGEEVVPYGTREVGIGGTRYRSYLPSQS